MRRTLAARWSLVVVAALVVVLARPGVSHAQAKPAAAPVKSGEAAGSFTASNGKVTALTHAAAFVDQKDATKPVVLLLTDAAVPAEILSGASSVGMSQNMGAHPFTGLVFWLDKDRKIFRQEVWEKTDQTATSGLFELTLDAPAGKVVSGSAKSNAAAAKQSKPMKLNVTFNAAVK